MDMERVRKSIAGCRDKDLTDIPTTAVHAALEAGGR